MGNFGRGKQGLCFVREGRVRGCQVACLVGGPSQNWGLHPEPRRRSRHSRGEKYVLAGGAGQNMILSFSAGCGRRNSARRALPGEGDWTERWVRAFGFFAGCRPDLLGVPCRASPLDGRIGYPKGGFPTPKAFPSGGRCPVRTLGWMRGRFGTQPFLVEKRRSIGCRLNEVFLLLRWATRSPPHPSPSVTASPQGEASGLCSPTRKSVPNQGT